MKTFDQLTTEQQTKAIERAMEDLITSICDGAITFNDAANCDNLQARINKAWAKAETMHTPWFIGEYITGHRRPKEAVKPLRQVAPLRSQSAASKAADTLKKGP